MFGVCAATARTACRDAERPIRLDAFALVRAGLTYNFLLGPRLTTGYTQVWTSSRFPDADEQSRGDTASSRKQTVRTRCEVSAYSHACAAREPMFPGARRCGAYLFCLTNFRGES